MSSVPHYADSGNRVVSNSAILASSISESPAAPCPCPMFTLPRQALRYVVYASITSLFLTVIYYNSVKLSPFPQFEEEAPVHVWETRAEDVKDAFLHAYHGYEKYAAPFDELLPVSASGVNKYNLDRF